jgi:hypothetical protein
MCSVQVSLDKSGGNDGQQVNYEFDQVFRQNAARHPHIHRREK